MARRSRLHTHEPPLPAGMQAEVRTLARPLRDAFVWKHNTHAGDARYTDMARYDALLSIDRTTALEPLRLVPRPEREPPATDPTAL